MDAMALGAMMGARAEAAGAQAGLRDALEACRGYQARIAELELALSVKTAHAAGLEAQLAGYIHEHPQSPVRADSGQRYKATGNTKTNGRLLYEAAFDRVAREKGICEPTAYRAD